MLHGLHPEFFQFHLLGLFQEVLAARHLLLATHVRNALVLRHSSVLDLVVQRQLRLVLHLLAREVLLRFVFVVLELVVLQILLVLLLQ